MLWPFQWKGWSKASVCQSVVLKLISPLHTSWNASAKIAEYKEAFANPYKAASRGYVDEVIDPADTRERVAAAFELLAHKKKGTVERKHGIIPV